MDSIQAQLGSNGRVQPSLIGVVAIVIPILFAIYLWNSDYRLASFPGPRLGGWTRLHSVAVLLTGKEHEKLLEAHEKYGPVVRWQPNMLLINDPAMLPKIYHLRANKTPHYNHSPSEAKGMTEENDWQKHREKRHRIDPAFSPKVVQGSEALVDGFVSKWIDALDNRLAATGQIFDFSDWGNYLVLDIVTKSFFGQEMGFLEHGDRTGMLADTRANGPIIHALARLPRLKMFLLRSLGRFLVPTAGDGSGLGNVLQLRDSLYEERLSKGDVNSNIGLDRILFKNVDDGTFKHEEFKEDVLFVILGASDTTGHAIRCLVRNLLQTPQSLTRLRQEIDALVTKSGGISHVQLSQITSEIPYLSACIRESLRFDPPIVSFLPRWVDNPDGIELCGKHVPQGVEVACSPYVLSRNRGFYGDDVHTFRPERYSAASLEWLAKTARYDFTFGYGPRHCIGQTLSHMITCKAIVHLLYSFDIDLIEPGSGKAFLNWNYFGLKLRLRHRAA